MSTTELVDYTYDDRRVVTGRTLNYYTSVDRNQLVVHLVPTVVRLLTRFILDIARRAVRLQKNSFLFIIAFGLVSSVPRQKIGWEERL